MNPKVLLIGAGIAAFLFREQLAAMLTGESTEAPAGNTGNTGGQNPGGQQTPVVLPPVTEALISKASWDAETAALLGNRKLLNVHQWNWYLRTSEKAIDVQDDLTSVSGADPNVGITAAQYQARAKAAGYPL